MEGARGEERFSFNYRLNILFFFIFYFPFFCLKYLNFVKLDFGLRRFKSIGECENGVAPW